MHNRFYRTNFFTQQRTLCKVKQQSMFLQIEILVRAVEYIGWRLGIRAGAKLSIPAKLFASIHPASMSLS